MWRVSQCWAGRRAFGTPARRAESRRMNVSRIPGLVLPVAFLLALVVGAVWYWRHRGD